MANSIGERLVTARGARTRKKVSDDLNIPYSTMCAYEKNERRPSDKIKRKIAAYYEMTVQELFY